MTRVSVLGVLLLTGSTSASAPASDTPPGVTHSSRLSRIFDEVHARREQKQVQMRARREQKQKDSQARVQKNSQARLVSVEDRVQSTLEDSPSRFRESAGYRLNPGAQGVGRAERRQRHRRAAQRARLHHRHRRGAQHDHLPAVAGWPSPSPPPPPSPLRACHPPRDTRCRPRRVSHHLSLRARQKQRLATNSTIKVRGASPLTPHTPARLTRLTPITPRAAYHGQLRHACAS